jgi:hypothetical protein
MILVDLTFVNAVDVEFKKLKQWNLAFLGFHPRSTPKTEYLTPTVVVRILIVSLKGISNSILT